MGVCVAKDPRSALVPHNPIQASSVGSSVILESTVHTDIQKSYQFKRVLGHGQFGTVREALMIGTGRVVAVKSINKEKIKKDLYLLKRELDVLRMIDHPNVIKYYETYEDEKYLHIVMELCSGGDLFDKLIEMGTLNETEVANVMKKLLLAVNHMHGLFVVHRDLKPENFLFSSRDPGAEIKVIDFGMSIKHQSSDLTTLVGTPYYLAPEVLRGKYGKECDIWSLGVVMYLMLCGYQPFEGEDMREIFAKISKGEFNFHGPEWAGVSDSAKDMIRKMMSVNPSKRISIEDALRHPWLAIQRELATRVVSKEVLNSLKRYKAPKKIQQEAMKVIIKFLSEADIDDLKSAFIDLDRDQTGFITIHDLEMAMQNVGLNLPSEEVKKIIRSLDYLKLGKIKYTDFLMATLDKKRLLDEELLFLAFQHFDADSDGFINVSDLKKAMSNNGTEMTNEDIEMMIADWDLDHNRQIDYQEFKRMMEESKV